jgi:hypothetical protein
VILRGDAFTVRIDAGGETPLHQLRVNRTPAAHHEDDDLELLLNT